jgi:hypothetical protein
MVCDRTRVSAVKYHTTNHLGHDTAGAMLKTGLTSCLYAAELFLGDIISSIPDILRRFLLTTAYVSCPMPAESNPQSHKIIQHLF